MKTNLFIGVVLFASGIALGQSKKEIMYEIEQFKVSTINKNSYDVPYDQLWDVIYSVGNTEYNEIKKEAKSKGYIDFYQEEDTYQESLTIEILGEKQPYRISFQFQQLQRSKNIDGTYSGWSKNGSIPAHYLLKLKQKIWVALYGEIQYPESIIKKIDDYNKKETKDRKKIMLGRDY